LFRSAASYAPIKILGQAFSLVRQGKWLFVSPSNFVILEGQLQNSRDVCLLLTAVIVRDVGEAVT